MSAPVELIEVLDAHLLVLEPRSKLPARLPGSSRRLSWSDATNDPEVVGDWDRRVPGAGWGLACRPSGLAVIDVDVDEGDKDGYEDLRDLEADLGQLPETVQAKTGGGGEHRLFRHPGGDLVGRLAPGVEVKSNGYIAIEPTIHPETGMPYRWDPPPGEIEVPEFPERWRGRIVKADRIATVRQGPAEGGDWIASRPPAEYVEVLAGVKAAPGTKIRCPLPDHEDRTPSFQVYGDARGGWYCFGCRRGGSVYDFAAALAGWRSGPLRGSDFLAVEEGVRTMYERWFRA